MYTYICAACSSKSKTAGRLKYCRTYQISVFRQGHQDGPFSGFTPLSQPKQALARLVLSGVNSPHHCISSHEVINIMHQGSTQLRIVWWWSELQWITRRVWKSALTYAPTYLPPTDWKFIPVDPFSSCRGCCSVVHLEPGVCFPIPVVCITLVKVPRLRFSDIVHGQLAQYRKIAFFEPCPTRDPTFSSIAVQH